MYTYINWFPSIKKSFTGQMFHAPETIILPYDLHMFKIVYALF